jgi:hypothetical protein
MADPEAKPVLQRDEATVELGVTGLEQYGGMVQDDFLPELTGTQRYRTYREMSSNDPVVGAVLFCIDMLIRQVQWTVKPGGEGPAAQAAAELVEAGMAELADPWCEFVSEIMTMLPFGFALFEQVFQVRPDGRIGWKRFGFRAQDTIWKWEFTEAGLVTAAEQMAPPNYRQVRLPLEKCLLFRTATRKGNPLGVSVLRTAYRPWFFKRRMEEIEAIGIERDLAGLPVMYVPPACLNPKSPADQVALGNAAKEMVKRIRADQQRGVVLPASYDEKGNQLWKLELLTSGGSRTVQTNTVIQRYDRAIAMAALADFILLGHEKVGSFALASSKTDIFATALGAWLDGIAGTLNRSAIPTLCDLNGIAPEDRPIMEHGDLETPDLGQLGTFLQQATAAGILTVDTNLEDYVRRVADLPERNQAA